MTPDPRFAVERYLPGTTVGDSSLERPDLNHTMCSCYLGARFLDLVEIYIPEIISFSKILEEYASIRHSEGHRGKGERRKLIYNQFQKICSNRERQC